MKVTGGIKRAGVSMAVSVCAFLALAAPTTYYVDPDNGSDSYDGKAAKWEGGESKVGPKQTIAAAVGLANSGDTVVLKPTTYFVTERIVRNTGFALKGGSDNAADTVIDGNGTSSFLSVESGASTFPGLYNLTVRNCYQNGCGGAISYLASMVTVSNCVFDACVGGQGGALGGRAAWCCVDCTFRNCRATSASVSGGALQVDGIYNYNSGIYGKGDLATMVNCTFENCTGTEGGAIYSRAYLNMTNCTFRNNVAKVGGAINGALTYATNCLFIGNVATNSCGGAYFPQANYSHPVRFEGCSFVGNTSTNGGGGAVVERGCAIAFTGCTFERNGSIILSGTEVGSGGALGIERSPNQTASAYLGPIEDCIFKANYCIGSTDNKETVYGGKGGAICGPFDRISGCVFEDNYAQFSGGAVSSIHRTSVDLTSFIGLCDFPPPDLQCGQEVTNCTFRGNHVGGEALLTSSAQFLGGAINFAACRQTGDTYPYYYYELTEHPILDCVFVSNTVAGIKGDPNYRSPRLGGAVNAPMGVRLERCAFTNNFCEGAGGAVNCHSANAIADCIFFGNRAASTNCLQTWRSACGGALSMQDGPVGTWQELVRCEFTSNSVGGTCGSAVALGQGNLRVTDCTFTGNALETNFYEKTTWSWGGALTIDPRAQGPACMTVGVAKRNTDSCPITCAVDRCTFVGNVAQGAGAALAMPVNYTKTVPGVVGSVRNCLFRDNMAKFLRDYDNNNKTYDLLGTGGAMKIAAGLRISVENCTFAGNAAESFGGQLDCQSTLAGVTNCIFHCGRDASADGSTADFRVEDVRAVDYCFASLASQLLVEGFHNRKSNMSPFLPEGDCLWTPNRVGGRDQGLTLSWMTDGAKDLAGNARVKGPKPDFGCFERQVAPGIMIMVR